MGMETVSVKDWTGGALRGAKKRSSGPRAHRTAVLAVKISSVRTTLITVIWDVRTATMGPRVPAIAAAIVLGMGTSATLLLGHVQMAVTLAIMA